MIKYCQSSAKYKVMSLKCLVKEVRDEDDFLHTHKHKSFLQVDFNTLSNNISYKVTLTWLMGMIRHYQSIPRNKFAISLQYPKNELRMEFLFCRQRNIKVSGNCNLPHLMGAIAHAHIITSVYDTFCLGHWNEESWSRWSNWIADHFSLTFVNLSLAWMMSFLYEGESFTNKLYYLSTITSFAYIKRSHVFF